MPKLIPQLKFIVIVRGRPAVEITSIDGKLKVQKLTTGQNKLTDKLESLLSQSLTASVKENFSESVSNKEVKGQALGCSNSEVQPPNDLSDHENISSNSSYSSTATNNCDCDNDVHYNGCVFSCSDQLNPTSESHPTEFKNQNSSYKTQTNNQNQPSSPNLKTHHMTEKPYCRCSQLNYSDSVNEHGLENGWKRLLSAIIPSFVEDSVLDSTEEAKSQNYSPEQKELINPDMQEPSLDIKNIVAFLSSMINKIEPSVNHQANEQYKQELVAMEDRITAQVLRTVREMVENQLGPKSNGVMDTESNEIGVVESKDTMETESNEAIEVESNAGMDSSTSLTIHTLCNGDHADHTNIPSGNNEEVAESNRDISADEDAIPNLVTIELLGSDSYSDTANEDEENEDEENEDEDEEQELRTALNSDSNDSDSAQDIPLTIELIQSLLNYRFYNMYDYVTKYIDVSLEKSLKDLENRLLKELTNRLEFGSTNSVESVVTGIIDNVIEEKIIPQIEERISENILSEFLKDLYDDLNDYIHDEIEFQVCDLFQKNMSKFCDDVIERLSDQRASYKGCKFAQDFGSYNQIDFVPQTQCDIDYNDPFSHHENQEKSYDLDHANANMDARYCPFPSKDRVECKTSLDEDSYSSSNSNKDSSLSNRCPSLYHDDYMVQGLDEDYDQMESNPNPWDNSSLYPQFPKDEDEESEEDPYDDNDDLFDDDQLMNRLGWGIQSFGNDWSRENKAGKRTADSRTSDGQTAPAKNKMPIMSCGEFTQQYRDPFTGQIVTETRSYRKVFQDEKSQQGTENAINNDSSNAGTINSCNCQEENLNTNSNNICEDTAFKNKNNEIRSFSPSSNAGKTLSDINRGEVPVDEVYADSDINDFSEKESSPNNRKKSSKKECADIYSKGENEQVIENETLEDSGFDYDFSDDISSGDLDSIKTDQDRLSNDSANSILSEEETLAIPVSKKKSEPDSDLTPKDSADVIGESPIKTKSRPGRKPGRKKMEQTYTNEPDTINESIQANDGGNNQTVSSVSDDTLKKVKSRPGRRKKEENIEL